MIKHLSFTSLKRHEENPYKWFAHYVQGVEMYASDSDALLSGNVVDAMLLDPAKLATYAQAPKCDRRTKEGKEMHNAFVAKLGFGKTVIPFDLYEQATTIANSVIDNAGAKKLMAKGDFQQEIIAELPTFNSPFPFRGFLDICRTDKDAVIDLKVYRDTSTPYLANAICKARIHAQLALYSMLYEAHYKRPCKVTALILADPEQPYTVRNVIVPPDVIAGGKVWLQQRVDAIKYTLNNPVFPEFEDLDFPEWAKA
jgi:hypothetical protein